MTLESIDVIEVAEIALLNEGYPPLSREEAEAIIALDNIALQCESVDITGAASLIWRAVALYPELDLMSYRLNGDYDDVVQ